MHSTVSIRQSIILTLIFILLIGCMIPTSFAAYTTYPIDGIYEDTFSNNASLTLPNCAVVNGAVELTRGLSHFTYDFATNLNHEAFAYRSIFFIPTLKRFSPTSILSKEKAFDLKDINNIKKNDSSYANRSGSLLYRCVIQHFRIQLNNPAEAYDHIYVNWYGKAASKATVQMYFWNASKSLNNGAWQKLGAPKSGGKIVSFNETITKGDINYALDDGNYIDICLVAHVAFLPHFNSISYLSTNYIKLYSSGEQGYKVGYGHAITKDAINPLGISTHFSKFYWDTLTWDDYQSGGATIRYQLYYQDESKNDVLVPNEDFPYNTVGNNSYGFSHPPVYLNAVPYQTLKIQANLSTDTPLVSPRIFSWAITWQNYSQWQDLFYTTYRIDTKNNIQAENHVANISRMQGEWPMVGFNPENTRATTGDGPSAAALYWYSNEYVGGGFRSPVIGNGKVYIMSNSRTLYQYNMKLPSGTGPESPQTKTTFYNFSYDVVNSPAVTDDYVIVATGQTGSKGSVNRIYVLKKDAIHDGPIRNFTNDNTKICYYSSPVVAGGNIYITSWGGDTDSYVIENNRYTNNKLLSINIQDISKTWQKELSGPSYSSPAVSLTHNVIVAGCDSWDNDSVYAFSLDGTKLWSKNIGAIGYASPVISDNTVYVTAMLTAKKTIKTNIYALNLTDGKILWNKTICESKDSYSNNGDSTPAIFNNLLYVASPDGTLYALHISDGSELWHTSVYTRSLLLGSPASLTSSPVYADGKIYLGLPSAQIIARNAVTGEDAWSFDTFQAPDFGNSPVYGSPIISNGLLFVADENGNLYSIGSYKVPTQQLNGSITSIPIRIPESFWWYRFYAYTSYNSSISSITFKLLDQNNTFIKDLSNGTSLPLSNKTLPRVLRLRADFTTKNISANNPNLLRWELTFTKDSTAPFINSTTIYPKFTGWLNIVVPRISIKVKDNATGLLINSAQYTLQYVINNATLTNTFYARCTGTNGTTEIQNMTANLSAIPDYKNITLLSSITFTIKDLAGNTATKYISIKQDTIPPSSYIKKQLLKPRYNSTAKFIWINATSFDNGTTPSGIKQVKLYYRYSTTGNFSGSNWVLFANSTRKQPTYKFNFSSSSPKNGGYYDVCTVAIDNASNTEAFPTKGDASFLYDWKAPDLPSYHGETLWFKEQPDFTVSFSDDFRLHTIQYRPNFETSWTTIATNVNKSTYNTPWHLKDEFWDQMDEGGVYYLYFKINDTMGNTRLITDDANAITIRKDVSIPTVSINVPSSGTEAIQAENFTVNALVNDQSGSGIKDVSLFYRYSTDKSTWSDWTMFGDLLDSTPYTWEFNASKGDGYYEFKINVTDNAGNAAESEVFASTVSMFPMTLSIILIGLVAVLLLLSVVVYIKWRKKT
jgi:outer membrane protein assembly factor BamB